MADQRVAVIPGRFDVQRDRAKAPCAACGAEWKPLTLERQSIGGIGIMLCLDFRACNRRSGVLHWALIGAKR